MTPDEVGALLDEYEPGEFEGEHWSAEELERRFQAAADEKAAQRLMRQRERLIRDVAAVHDRLKPERERLDAFEDDMTGGMKDAIARIDKLLEAWQRQEGRKQFRTPYGTTRLNPTSKRVEVTDEAKFLAWVIENGYWALVRMDPAKSVIGDMKPGPAIEDWANEAETAISLMDEDEFVPGVAIVQPKEGTWTPTPKAPK